MIDFRFSDENGIKFEGLEQLQIFLLKLKHYELIDSVTTLVKQEFNYRLDRVIINFFTL